MTQLIIGNLYPPHPRSLASTHPQSAAVLQGIHTICPCLISHRVSAIEYKNVSICRQETCREERLTEKQPWLQQGLWPPATGNMQADPSLEAAADTGNPKASLSEGTYPNLNLIFLTTCLIKESSFHASTSVPVHTVQLFSSSRENCCVPCTNLQPPGKAFYPRPLLLQSQEIRKLVIKKKKNMNLGHTLWKRPNSWTAAKLQL